MVSAIYVLLSLLMDLRCSGLLTGCAIYDDGRSVCDERSELAVIT